MVKPMPSLQGSGKRPSAVSTKPRKDERAELLSGGCDECREHGNDVGTFCIITIIVISTIVVITLVSFTIVVAIAVITIISSGLF